jgi:hypothetical protein
MKDILKDNTAPLFLQIANELGRLRLQGYKPNRLIINKRLEPTFHVYLQENVTEDVFPNMEVLFTSEKFDFSFEEVIEQYKFIKKVKPWAQLE